MIHNPTAIGEKMTIPARLLVPAVGGGNDDKKDDDDDDDEGGGDYQGDVEGVGRASLSGVGARVNNVGFGGIDAMAQWAGWRMRSSSLAHARNARTASDDRTGETS
jgi:hypothetical protein